MPRFPSKIVNQFKLNKIASNKPFMKKLWTAKLSSKF